MIGERLFTLRKKAKLSQEELGEILKINKHSVSAYEKEKNQPSDEIKIRIANYFHVSVDYLLGLTDNPLPYSAQNFYPLPKDLPREALDELKSYMEYIITKYQN